ncbi:MAG TPA: efflux RND transporter periplasmic adaptor subunit [Burkholderiaceae bacterium]|nr:efflux RND transporter periplasmic adaptor subunit [Burkholderiaceae bacterium]
MQAIRRQRDRPRSAYATVLALALLLAGCRWPWHPDDGTTPIVLSGTVDARQIDLSFQAPGRIAKLHTDEGHRIEPATIVAELDPTDYELAVARARAQAESARKALAVLRAGSRPQEVRTAAAMVAQAEADKRFADQEVLRANDLVEKHFFAREELDRARSAADVAAAKLEQARQTSSLVREGPRKEDIERAQAELTAAEAAQRSAEQQLSYVRLASPAAGVISVRLAEAGQVVAAGQPVFRLAQLDRPWVRAYLSEPDLARVKLGQDAQVRVDGLPGKTFKGRLAFISPQAEFTPKTVETRALRVDLVYRVTVDVDDGGAELKIGMPADVTLARVQP